MQTELSFLWELYKQILKEQKNADDNDMGIYVSYDVLLDIVKTRIDELLK